MRTPTPIPAGAGEVVGDSPDRRVEILSDHDSLHATWSRFGPGREGADLHVHRRHTDLFYVLEGELTVRLGVEDEQVPVPAGSLARVPPMVVHGFRNASAAEVTYLNMHAPGRGFADFMRALRDGRELGYDQEPPPDEGTRPMSEAVIGPALADTDAIAVAELRLEAGEPAPAAENGRLESLYVLAGELAGSGLRAGEGSWLQHPAGSARELSAATQPTRVLRILTPG